MESLISLALISLISLFLFNLIVIGLTYLLFHSQTKPCRQSSKIPSIDTVLLIWNLLFVLLYYGGAAFCFTYFFYTNQIRYIVLLPGVICLVACGVFSAMLVFNPAVIR